MKIKPKSEKGAITLIALVGMVFLTTFLMSMYISIANKAQSSAETTKQISEKYNNLDEANAIYDSYFAETDIIPIYTTEQLKKVGSGEQIEINGKIYTFSKDAYYTIQNDLNLGGVYNESTGTWSGTQWTPLTSEFTGILDGLGYTITGLYIDSSNASNQGLFGTLNGTVKNLSIEDSYVKANAYVGSIAGKNEGTIVNCYNTGSIIGNTNVTGGYFKSITTGETIEVWSDNVLEENTYFVSGSNIATAPKGFKVSKKVFEQTIENGMVIQDENGNEFVWVPVEENLGEYYKSDSSNYEPIELEAVWSPISYETRTEGQVILDELYGANYYTYSEDFKFVEEYAEMVKKVNQYNGFYIGRYETTIDSEGNIGSEYNKKVLTAGTVMFTEGSTTYPYRWYGLYYAQKNANVSGNGTDVQTAMIYGVLWDKTMNFIKIQFDLGNTLAYDVTKVHDVWHGSMYGHTGDVVNSAQSNPGETGDVALNIWDLESNGWEWTQDSYSINYRIGRGGGNSLNSSASNIGGAYPTDDGAKRVSRLALYVK